MNILIFSWRGPNHPTAGGAEISTHEHAKGWVRAGHKVTLFTAYFVGAREYETIDGVYIIRKGSDVFGVHLEAFFWYIFKNHERFDLVVDQFHGIPFFTPLYVTTKKLAFIHEVAKEVWFLNPWPKPFNLIPAVVGGLFEPLVFKIFYKKIHFMTVSQSTKDDLKDWGIASKNISIIHNGVNLESLPKILPPKERKKTAIFLGAISRDKGFEDALKVFKDINKNDFGWQFWIVGNASLEMKQLLEQELAKFGDDTRLKYWGYVSNGKKFELLARAHILVNPSVREGWGLVNIEANAVGTPVVGYNVSGTKDSIVDGKTGILVKFGDYNGLMTSITGLCNDIKRYNTISKNATDWAKQFTWDKSISKSLKLLKIITNS